MIVHAELELVHTGADAVCQERDVILAEVEKTILGLGHHCGANINSAPPPMFQPLRVTLTDMSDTE